ncbi:MAG TPA: hypothetical protein VGK32_14000 [Vicinamibacterales bacterium]
MNASQSWTSATTPPDGSPDTCITAPPAAVHASRPSCSNARITSWLRDSPVLS